MRNMLAAVVALSWMIALTGASYAEPSAYGDTGLIFIPTADVAPEEVYDFYARNLSVGAESRQFISAAFGIDERFEVSAAQLITPAGSAVGPATFLNVKFRFDESTDIDTPIAIGVQDIIGRGPNGRTFYAVATNYFGDSDDRDTSSRMTVGLAFDQVNGTRFMLGLDADISDTWRGLIELDGRSVNLGVRYIRERDEKGQGFSADLFLRNVGQPGGNNPFIGFGYRWTEL